MYIIYTISKRCSAKTARQAPAGSTDMNHTLFSDQASAQWFHLEYIIKVFYPGVSLSLQTFGFIPPFCTHIKRAHTHTQTFLSSWYAENIEVCLKNATIIQWKAEGDTWEFANMSFLPCFLGVHCELLNLLHGKTPNAEAKERRAIDTSVWKATGFDWTLETWRQLELCGKLLKFEIFWLITSVGMSKYILCTIQFGLAWN